MFKLFAHRGASADAADNSFEAFELAIEQGSDFIETDVRQTADGVLILEHDPSIEGLEVPYHTFAKLKEKKPHLLTVAETIKAFGERIPFCFEFKQAGLEHSLIYLLKDLLPEDMWRATEFSSFNIASAVAASKLLKALGQTNQVGFLTRQWDADSISLCKDLGLNQICPRAQSVLDQPEFLELAKNAGLKVRVWLIETPELTKALNELMVYGGTVNFPRAAKATLLAK